MDNKTACSLAHEIRKNTGCSLAEAFKAAYAGTTPTQKTHWSRNDLDKIFSDKAAELLRKGYTIATNLMGDHQGEIAKLILRKGDKVLILVMDRTHDFGKLYGERISIRLDEASEEDVSRNNIWLNHATKTIWSFEARKLSDNYFTTNELANEASAKAAARWKNQEVTYITTVSEDYYKVILPLVRKQKGFKSTNLNNITEVRRVMETEGFQGINRKIVGRHYTVHIEKAGKISVLNIKF